MAKLDYEFVFTKGGKILKHGVEGSMPAILFKQEQYIDLANIAFIYASNRLVSVLDDIGNIKAVMAGDQEKHFIGDEWCNLDIYKEKTDVWCWWEGDEEADYFDPYELPTTEILRLMEEWAAFLQANGY